MQVNRDVKIILLGESDVGKTSLLLRFVSGIFKEFLPRTTIDYKKKIIKIKDMAINLEVWDTAGQEMYHSLVRRYYRIADGVILVYDVQNADTFLKLSKWLVDLKEDNEKAEIIIAGNKSEDQSKKSVNISVVRNFAKTENIEHVEVSAKSGGNVEFLFRHLVKKILAAKGILTFSKSCVLEKLARNGEYFSPSGVIPEHSSSKEDQEKLNKDKIAAVDSGEQKVFKSVNDFGHASNNIEPKLKTTTQLQEQENEALIDLENIKLSGDKHTLITDTTQFQKPGDGASDRENLKIFENNPTLTILTTQLQEPRDELDSSQANSGCLYKPQNFSEEEVENSDTEFAESALEFFERFSHEDNMLVLPPEQTDIIKLTETEPESDEESCCVI